MAISSPQIRAARGLLGWTQTDLATASGLHLNAISKIEKEFGAPRRATLERIQTTCEAAGVSFRGQRGVELREDVFKTWRFEGPEYIRHHVDDILAVMRGPEDEILNFITDEQLFNVADRKTNEYYYRRLEKIGFRERYIMSKAHDTFMNSNREAYRWLPEKVLGTVAYGVYRDRVAFIKWQTQELLIIRNQSLSDTFRGQFEFLWAQAKAFK